MKFLLHRHLNIEFFRLKYCLEFNHMVNIVRQKF